MFGIGIIEIALLLVLVAAVARLVLAAARRVGSAPTTSAPDRESRRVQTSRLAGLVAGLAAAWVVAGTGRLGTGAMLAPAVLGLGVLAGVVVGETVARPPRPDGPRSASLAPRRVRDHLPRGLTATVALMLLLLAATCVVTTATATADSTGTAGRALACVSPDRSSARSPYPGSYYTLPLGLVLVVVLVLAALAAVAVVRRPRGLAAEGEAGEAALRRRSLTVVVAATGLATCGPQVGISLYAASGLGGLGVSPEECAPAWWGPTSTALWLVALAAAVVVVVCAVRLVGGRR